MIDQWSQENAGQENDITIDNQFVFMQVSQHAQQDAQIPNRANEKNSSKCIEGCAVNWPPFRLDPSAAVWECEPGDFATITRSDGLQQTTYKGMPLYYFKNDKYPGDTFGHGIGGAWFLVTP